MTQVTRQLSEEDELEAAIRYKMGASTVLLARRFGVGTTVINYALRKQGVELRPGPQQNRALTDTIVRLRRHGNTWEEVARLAGCSVPTARKRWAQHHGKRA